MASRGATRDPSVATRNADSRRAATIASRRAPSSRPAGTGDGSRASGSAVPVASSTYASAACCTSASVSGPGATCRRVGSSGKEPSSRAGRSSGSSVGVGACSTSGTGCPASGSAQARFHQGRSRSSTGRSASRCGCERAGPAYDLPPVGVRDDDPALALDLHHDLGQGGQRQQQRIVDVGEQRARQVGGGGVAQRQPHRRVEAGHRRGGRRPRQPQHRQLAGATTGLVGERLDLGDGGASQVGVPADRAAGGGDLGGVGHGQYGGEADPEPAGGRAVALGRGPQGRQRLDAGGVQRRTGVRGGEYAVGQRQQQPAGLAGPGSGVRGVLRQLDHHAVAVAAAHQVVLGVRVLAEPGRRRRPRVEHPTAQRRSVERVVTGCWHAPDATSRSRTERVTTAQPQPRR